MDLARARLRFSWRVHKAIDRITGGRYDTSWFGGLPSLFLTTTGRTSGQLRTVGLFYIERGREVAVVASNAGAERDPAWWRNLQAHPDAEISLGRERRHVRARQATAEEEAELWPRLEAANRDYAKYRRETGRRIPVVILEPAEPGYSS